MIIATVRKARLLLALPLMILVIAGCPLPSDSSSSAKAITAFGFLAQSAVGVISEANGTISVPVSYGTTLTALVASFATTGASVKMGSVVQVSGTTPDDFTNPVTYVVFAADGTTKSYTVTVSVQSSSAKAITAFGFPAQSAVGVISEVSGTISVTVPYGTPLTALVAAFATTGASVKVGSLVQVNNTTPNNFTNPVTYVVAAADASTKSYVVTVTVHAPSHDASLSNAVLVDSLSTTYTFVPAFSPTTYIYTGVSPATPSGGNPIFTLTLTTTDLNATITSVIETPGNYVDSHIGSAYTLTLASYDNTVTILVTAQDGTTTKTYTMAIQARWRG